MTLRTALPLGLASLLALAAPGLALTPDEAWEGWQAHAEARGFRVAHGAASGKDGALHIPNVALDRRDSDGAGMNVDIGDVEFALRSDGAVVMTAPDRRTLLAVTLPDLATGEPQQTTFIWTAVDEITVLSGSLDALTVDYSAPKITITLDKLPPLPGRQPVDISARALIDGLTVHSVLTIRPDGSSSLSNDLRMAGLSLTGTVKVPDETLDFSIAAGPAEVAANRQAPPGFSPGDVDRALRAGYGREVRGKQNDLKLSVLMRTDGSEKRGSWTLGSIELDQLLSRERLGFSSTLRDLVLDADPLAADMPPLSARLEELRIGLSGPGGTTEDPQDFSTRLHLAGLVLSEGIWGLIDPQAHFERGPASLRLDLSGKGRWLEDMFAIFAQLDAPARLSALGRLPLELESLTLSRAELSLSGLNATAEGDLVFDNTDLSTWEGFPRPSGKISASFLGLNAMIERLAKAGLIPPAQLMPLRMGLAMFTRAAPGEDRRVSMIEFRGRNLLINGQRIR